MRRALLIVLAIFPLAVTAAAFKWFPTSDLVAPVIIGSLLLGWIGLGFALSTRRWLKVLLLVIYPFAMWVAVVVVMALVYGIPGLH